MKFIGNDKLEEILKVERKKYNSIKKEGYLVDIARGKPCKEQLDSVMGFFSSFNEECYKKMVPYRNYGVLEGIPELRQLFADVLEVEPNEIICGGNSSLNMMYDAVQRAMQFGLLGEEPWNKQGQIKFLCPAPGYDRHFGITQHLGIEMITVPMREDGPDMDIIEKLVATDKQIKGMWCVPKYSNPTGITFSDDVVRRLAKMKVAASDFRIFWDNAYCVHDLYEEGDVLLNLLNECKRYATEDRVFMFASTSKITFPGAGVAFMAASQANIKDALSHIKHQTICFDKINQLMHVEFIKSKENLNKIMQNHANIIRPKFETVINALEKEFGSDCDIAKWTKPNGGYFISLDLLPGTARKVYQYCKEAGLTITTAGDTFPYGNDVNDSNLRIAPTFTSKEDLDISCEILVNCVKIACIEKLLNL